MSAKRIESLRLIWIEAFLWVYRGASVGDAARALGCNQSNVSRYIAQLEDWLGKELFVSFAPTTTTEHGEEFAPIAREVVKLLYAGRRGGLKEAAPWVLAL